MREFSQLPVPLQVTPENQHLADALVEIQQELQNSLGSVHDLGVVNAAPAKPEEGMLRFADGVAWDPGSGAGFYYYEDGAWRKVLDLVQATALFAQPGYGGIRQAALGVAGPALGAGWYTVATFDTNELAVPVNVTQDHTTDSLALGMAGTWQVTLYLAFRHNSAALRATYVRVYDSVDLDARGTTLVTIGNFQTHTLASLSLLIQIDEADVGHPQKLQVGGGGAVSAVLWDAILFEAVKVS